MKSKLTFEWDKKGRMKMKARGLNLSYLAEAYFTLLNFIQEEQRKLEKGES